jgi:hypothetical protein
VAPAVVETSEHRGTCWAWGSNGSRKSGEGSGIGLGSGSGGSGGGGLDSRVGLVVSGAIRGEKANMSSIG